MGFWCSVVCIWLVEQMLIAAMTKIVGSLTTLAGAC
jgi:hypothetical protein